MKLFKPRYSRDGRNKTCSHWYIGFTDTRRIGRRLPAFLSKQATERAAMMLGELLSGNIAPHVQKWLEEIPETMRDKLIEWGLVDSRKWSANLGKALAEHLADYVEALRADGRKEHHIKQAQITFILDGCGFRAATDIESHKVKVLLAKGRGPDGCGERTYNSYLVAFKSFCNWLWRQGRAVGVNPMADCGRITQTEFRKKRRALSDDEVRRLLAATENGKHHHKLSGRERALIYALALRSGLRAGEIRSLTVASFDFTADPATVHVEPSDCKGKKPADIILMPETARALQSFLASKGPQDRAFGMPPARHVAEMLKMDVAAAEIPYTDNSGRDADFHSLRHTFISNLFRANVHPAVAQKLDRHSSIVLTMRFYTHVLRESEIEAMKRLACLSSACQNGVQVRTLADASGRKSGDIDSVVALSA